MPNIKRLKRFSRGQRFSAKARRKELAARGKKKKLERDLGRKGIATKPGLTLQTLKNKVRESDG